MPFLAFTHTVRATRRALKRERRSAASRKALSRQARSAAAEKAALTRKRRH
ncbi:MAG TPA: hypothetical protein VNN24_03855 [Candidatus Binatus sp.]|nr:hypothetical protein [Candidatus Binatus sp.]